MTSFCTHLKESWLTAGYQLVLSNILIACITLFTTYDTQKLFIGVLLVPLSRKNGNVQLKKPNDKVLFE